MRPRFVILGFGVLLTANGLLLRELGAERAHVRTLTDDKQTLVRRLTSMTREERAQEAHLSRLRQDMADADEPAGEREEIPAAEEAVRDGVSREHRKTLALRRHGEVLRALALLPEQRDALLDAIVTQEYRVTQGLADLQNDDDPNPDDLRVTAEAQKTKYQADVVAAIGAEKAAAFESLERTRPALNEVRAVRESLDAAGLPIDEGQRTRLVAILSKPDYQNGLDPSLVDAEALTMADPASRRERSKRFQQEAASVLTPQQLSQLEAFQAADEAVSDLRTREYGGETITASRAGLAKP